MSQRKDLARGVQWLGNDVLSDLFFMGAEASAPSSPGPMTFGAIWQAMGAWQMKVSRGILFPPPRLLKKQNAGS